MKPVPAGLGSTLNSTFSAEPAKQRLSDLRASQSFGLSLKKAVKRGFVRLAKVIGTDDGKGNYQVEVVKSTTVKERLRT